MAKRKSGWKGGKIFKRKELATLLDDVHYLTTHTREVADIMEAIGRHHDNAMLRKHMKTLFAVRALVAVTETKLRVVLAEDKRVSADFQRK